MIIFSQQRKAFCLSMVLLLGVFPLFAEGLNSSSLTETRSQYRGNIVVNASGSGDYTHIQWAIDNASNGDTIYVDAGTYRENVVVNKTVSLIGEGREVTTIDGSWSFVLEIKSDWVNVSGFNITNTRWPGSGIRLTNYNYSRIENNNVSNHDIGINLGDSHNNTINNNTCFSNSWCGIFQWYCVDNIITNNTCYSTIGPGISQYYTNYNFIDNNTCYQNINGIVIGNVSIGNIVSNNNCSFNSQNGICLIDNSNNRIANNTCASNKRNGIDLDYASLNCIFNNNITNSSVSGIRLYYYSDSNAIKNNNLSKNNIGIHIDGSKSEVISGNTMTGEGIIIDSIYWHINEESFWNSHQIDTANTIDNRPVQYWKNMSGGRIPGGSGQIILVNCTNIIIENQILDNCTLPIILAHSSNNTVRNNTCNTNFLRGISLYSSVNNTIENNTCSGNGKEGLRLNYHCNRNIIMNNTCNWNSISGISIVGNDYYNIITNNTCDSNNISGIILDESNGNRITMNICSHNKWDGLYLYYSDENTVWNNTWNSNVGYGVTLYSGSNGNYFYYNNFISNNQGRKQAIDNGYANNWNGLFEGNYWSDWTTPDNDNDGIVDQPYQIDGDANANDRFPLVKPIYDLPPVADAGTNITIDQYENITFNATNSWGFPFISNYTWSFNYNGSGILLYGSAPTFSFHIAGIYHVTLTVTNPRGFIDSDEIYVHVMDTEPPYPYAGPDDTIRMNEKYYFNGGDSWDNVGVVNYTWYFFYDGAPLQLHGETSKFTFNIPGKYNVTLDVTDARGNWATDSMVLTVLDSSWPVAEAGNDIIIDQYETAYLSGRGSYNEAGMANYTWTFTYAGQDIILYGLTVSFIFGVAGSYVITLNVSNDYGKWDTDGLNLTVIDITKPEAVARENITVYQDKTVYFNGTSSYDNVGIINYTWTFIYNNITHILYGRIQQFTFFISGNYTITLRVWDAANLWDEDAIWVRVLDRNVTYDTEKPDAQAGDNRTVTANSTVFFNASGSHDNVGIENFTWFFTYDGELIELYGPNASFTFTISGNYMITLRVRDAEWNHDDDVFVVFVEPLAVPVDPGDDGPENDDLPENDDTEGDTGETGEKRSWGSGRMMVLIIVCSIAIIAVLYYFLRREPEKDEAEEKTDEFGRTDAEMKPEVTDDEDDVGDVGEEVENEVDHPVLQEDDDDTESEED